MRDKLRLLRKVTWRPRVETRMIIYSSCMPVVFSLLNIVNSAKSVHIWERFNFFPQNSEIILF